MKIIHCADLHLDSSLTANLPSEKAKERKVELLNTFQRMIQFAVEHQVEAVMIAGDLFDKRKVSVTAKNVVLNAIQSHPQIDFYYLRGNHDLDNFLQDLERIPKNLKLFGSSWTSYVANAGAYEKKEDIHKICITGAELQKENSREIYSSLVLDSSDFQIVLLHGQDADYKTKEKAEIISLPELKNKGIDYLALGHIHEYREGMLDHRGIYCYPGCLEGRGFDECGEHGFVLLDIDPEDKTYTRTFVPIAKRNLYSVQVNISDCMTTSDIIRKAQNCLDEKQYGTEHMIKFVLTGEIDVACEKNLELLQEHFQQQYYFVRVKDNTKIKVDYQDFYLDHSLKGEFVRTVLQREEISDEEKAVIIRYGIQALAGEEMQ